MDKKYLKLGDLPVYRMSLELSNYSWIIYESLGWQDKKVFGDQYIRSIDSIGANIAEGYGRYHYKDRIKFYYNARGSLIEAKHWSLLLKNRKKISNKVFNDLLQRLNNIHKSLNTYIKMCYPR
ncbi:MAG: four helix bundle protein [Patescibacteria group bacterium]|nr:four helix bundle protein [Patescibacteria group bacterium]